MDIFTQGLIGATVSQSIAKKEEVKQATVIGFLSGMLADADTLIRSSTDPLLVLEYHRHFTHSIFFIPMGALIAFVILWPFFKNSLNNKTLYLYCLAGYSLSGFIDACTSYGTHLLWPLSDQRISWHIISIVDPLFSIILIITIGLGLYRKRICYPRYGIFLVSCYLLVAATQLNRAESSIVELARERGHEIEQIMVKPTIGNILLWRSIYLSNDRFYVDVVRAGLKKRIYKGDSIEQYQFDEAIDKDSTMGKDIKRFEQFSDSFVVYYPDKPNVLGDVRYSMNPIGISPLWGIDFEPENTQKHVAYNFYRESNSKSRKQFMNMLLGKEINSN